MKFIAWLFNFTNRHHADVFRYERKGILYRISILLLLTALGALVLFLEDWSFSIFNVSRLETFVTGFFAVLLFIATFIPTLELYVLYAYLGLSRAIRGSLDKLIEKNEKKRARKKRVNATESVDERVTSGEGDAERVTSGEGDAERVAASETAATKKRKVPAWLDAFVGVFSILLFFGLIALVIYSPSR